MKPLSPEPLSKKAAWCLGERKILETMTLDCQDSIQRTLFSKFNLRNYQNCVHDRRWHHEASLAPKINFVSSGINREETASPLRGRRGRKAAPVSPPLHPHGERPGLLQSQRIRVCAPDRERARERGFTWTRLAPIRSEGSDLIGASFLAAGGWPRPLRLGG